MSLLVLSRLRSILAMHGIQLACSGGRFDFLEDALLGIVNTFLPLLRQPVLPTSASKEGREKESHTKTQRQQAFKQNTRVEQATTQLHIAEGDLSPQLHQVRGNRGIGVALLLSKVQSCRRQKEARSAKVPENLPETHRPLLRPTNQNKISWSITPTPTMP